MTKAELIEKLKSLNSDDAAFSHQEADDLLVKFINDPEIEAAYEAIAKWYS